MNQERENQFPIEYIDISPNRCVLATHCNVAKAFQRLKQRSPRVRITTPDEKIAEIVGELSKIAKKPTHEIAEAPVQLVQLTDERTPGWHNAVRKAVDILKRVGEKNPNVVDTTTVLLFDSLRDPDKRDDAIKRVDAIHALYRTRREDSVDSMDHFATAIIQRLTPATGETVFVESDIEER